MAQVRQSRRPRQVFRSLLLVAALLAALCATLVTARPAFAGSCSSQGGQSVTDPNTGWHWTTKWYCGNVHGAKMYGDTFKDPATSPPESLTPTAVMNSTYSWFVCYRRGAMHAGGNNVWYYSLGDAALSPFQRRAAWGYMPAVSVSTSTDPWPGMPACPVGASPPPRTDGLNKPVYFIHGYDENNTGFSANVDSSSTNHASWYSAIQAYRYGASPTFSGTLGRAWTWCYYGKDVNCDLKHNDPPERDTPIQQLGMDLAQEIWDRFSRFGDSVDVVAHSMGGLIIRAAIKGTQDQDAGFPPYLYVEDVSTIGTPHRGTDNWGTTTFCQTQQCKDMEPGSPFFTWLYTSPNGHHHGENPQSAQGTDWTLIGLEDDLIVSSWSAVPDKHNGFGGSMPVGHKVVYDGGQFTGGGLLGRFYTHGIEPTLTSGSFRYHYCDYNDSSCDMTDNTTWHPVQGSDPIWVARMGNAYQTW